MLRSNLSTYFDSVAVRETDVENCDVWVGERYPRERLSGARRLAYHLEIFFG
jgi:hypothetical protein